MLISCDYPRQAVSHHSVFLSCTAVWVDEGRVQEVSRFLLRLARSAVCRSAPMSGVNLLCEEEDFRAVSSI